MPNDFSVVFVKQGIDLIGQKNYSPRKFVFSFNLLFVFGNRL